MMEFLGSTKNKVHQNKNSENVPHLECKNSENVPHLESTEMVLVHCNIVNNDYRHDSRVLYTFVSNKSFSQLLDISLKNFIILNTFNSEF